VTVTILDGGMGRELMRIGAPFRQPEWSALALLEGPQWVVQAHRNFIEAGAQVITTNAYAVVPFHLGEERFASDGHRLAGLAGEMARDAAREHPSVAVAGSLPPLFGSYLPQCFDAAKAPDIIDPLVDAQRPHVDVWLAETLSSVGEAIAVRDALDRSGDTKPLWVSFTLADSPRATLRSGETVADAARAASDLGAHAVLFNCCQVETLLPALHAARAVLHSAIATGGYANRFTTGHDGDGAANAQIAAYRTDVDPDAYASFGREWIDAGATLIGGCCGIEPAHIARLAALVSA
jgi:S-methylmethionine-dependent homocysteine/selenocysteine methylase